MRECAGLHTEYMNTNRVYSTLPGSDINSTVCLCFGGSGTVAPQRRSGHFSSLAFICLAKPENSSPTLFEPKSADSFEND